MTNNESGASPQGTKNDDEGATTETQRGVVTDPDKREQFNTRVTPELLQEVKQERGGYNYEHSFRVSNWQIVELGLVQVLEMDEDEFVEAYRDRYE